MLTGNMSFYNNSNHCFVTRSYDNIEAATIILPLFSLNAHISLYSYLEVLTHANEIEDIYSSLGFIRICL